MARPHVPEAAPDIAFLRYTGLALAVLAAMAGSILVGTLTTIGPQTATAERTEAALTPAGGENNEVF